MNVSGPKAKEVFVELIGQVPPEEWDNRLAQACGDNDDMRRRVQALLNAHRQADSFLEEPAVARVLEATASQPGRERPGTVIGPYKLLQQIGEGGFGIVFMAEQVEPVRRRVALKVIKPGMDTRQVIARFEAERQALAVMDHPNIARVFDAGSTDSRRPYFVMELVRGVPITLYCDENHLPVRERLELFATVCQAIQHAHQKGIIHRDIKPTNVLVTQQDGEPLVKVIDFGIAKAMGQQLTDKTLFTEFAQMIGTPLYMSPEQAAMSSTDIDTRSDIYSLGVLLYELLTGSTPISKEQLKQANFDEIRRIIREDEAQRPSLRIGSSVTLPAIAAHRHVEPARLRMLVHGELDWIVMKCLDKDRNRRYETAGSLGRDVERYLHDEPVQACPPSAWYRFRKFSRRNKSALAMGSVIAVALLASVVALGVSNWRIMAALKEARVEKQQALVAQAQANRLSRRPGQRFQTLEILDEATNLSRELKLPEERILELRNTVIGTLGLPDMQFAGPRHSWPRDGLACDFDERHAVYARTDQLGNCSVCRMPDDVEIQYLPGLGGRAVPYLSRDGKFLALFHFNFAVQLWDLNQVPAHQIWSEEKTRCIDFHPNGRQIAVGYNDGTIGLFDLPSGRLLSRLPSGIQGQEYTVALHPSEPLVAVCSYYGWIVQIRDLVTGEVLASLPGSDRPQAVAWHPDGKTLAIGFAEAQLIRLYDRTTFQPFRTFQTDQAVSALAFNHAGDRLASVGWASALQLFDVGTAHSLFSTDTESYSLRFSRDDRRLAGGVRDNKLGIWQLADGREYRLLLRKEVPSKPWGGHAISVSPDGRLLAAGMTDGFALWDLASGDELVFFPTKDPYTCVEFEQSGDLLVMCPDGLFRWPIEKQSVEQWVMGPPQRLPFRRGYSLGQSRDGRVIVTSARIHQGDPGGWILHTDRSDPPIQVDAGADVVYIAVSPDGRWVVTVTHNPSGKAIVWDARDGKKVKQLSEWGSGYPRFSPDGRWLSTELDGGRLISVGDWEPGPRVGGAGAFSPDGKFLALSARNGTIRLVDARTCRELATLEDFHQEFAEPPKFTPDGTKLVAFTSDKMVQGIRVRDLRLIRQHLGKMGLDWDAPPYPPDDPESKVIPLRLEVRLGDPTELDSRGETNR